MSFILDALRKSENERQRGAPPTLARTPQAFGTRSRTPLWTWFVIAGLSIALVVGTFAWLGSRRAVPTAAPVAEREFAERLPVRSPADSPESVAPADRAPLADPTSAEGLRDASPPSTTASLTDAARAPRPAGDMAALDPALPRYTLELLAYDGADPSSGYAWINGRRYFPGEQIGSGPQLVAVRSDGVLLEYRGEIFLLRQR